MIKLEKTETLGWEHAIRGMRNPMNSWDRTDSSRCIDFPTCESCPMYDENGQCNKPFDVVHVLGPNDHELMMKLAKGGPVHAKYRRMITVYVDITAPLYWWKEFDTYKVGTVANSCSTMHKIHAKEFTKEDFSCERLKTTRSRQVLQDTIETLNVLRAVYLNGGVEDVDTGHFTELSLTKVAKLPGNQYQVHDPKSKDIWDEMVQILPSSYNQKRTIMLNYEVLTGIYPMRKNHKLAEWREFCEWIESLPYSEIITGEVMTTDE